MEAVPVAFSGPLLKSEFPGFSTFVHVTILAIFCDPPPNKWMKSYFTSDLNVWHIIRGYAYLDACKQIRIIVSPWASRWSLRNN